ncbi:MAG: isoaspartyl peptidase/L-asparaginase, partial [Saprospiraceae bacterium]
DSPIIGSGLYVDNKIGAASATGLGEAVIKKVGAFSIVEMMRSGKSPQAACQEAIHRLLELEGSKDFQVGYIAINKNGKVGGYSLQPNFQYVVVKNGNLELFTSPSHYKK